MSSIIFTTRDKSELKMLGNVSNVEAKVTRNLDCFSTQIKTSMLNVTTSKMW